ncbi:MAG TPA: ABC transporter substrate-binding protein [Bradyrhizobium sp.]|nr:ABC transporter substrate-binding protein [Bradyrhizobium sp.]
MTIEKALPAKPVTRRTFVASVAALSLGGMRMSRAQTLEPLSVRVDFAPWGVHAALHLAQQKGWFKEAGLNIDLQDGTGTLNTINLVGAGRSDVGLVQLGPMAIGKSNGVPVKSFAGFLRKVDLAILVDAEKGPKDPKGLAGLKIVCFAGSTAAPFIDVFLKRLGFERGEGPNKVNFVMVSPTSMVSTYASGGADGFMSLKEFGEPLVMKTRPAHSFLAADYGIAYPSYGFMATEETISNKADALRRLNQTQIRAWTYIFADPAHIDEAAKAIIADRPNNQLDPDLLKAQITQCREFFDTPNTKGKPIGWQAPEDWKLAIASMTEAGLLKDALTPEGCFTNDLIGS